MKREAEAARQNTAARVAAVEAAEPELDRAEAIDKVAGGDPAAVRLIRRLIGPLPARPCDHCGKPFQPQRSTARFCPRHRTAKSRTAKSRKE